MMTGGEGFVVTFLFLIELCPGAHDKKLITLSLHIFDGDILIMLGGIGTHLQPQHSVGILKLTATEYHVAVVNRLTAEGQTAMRLAIGTVFDDDV